MTSSSVKLFTLVCCSLSVTGCANMREAPPPPNGAPLIQGNMPAPVTFSEHVNHFKEAVKTQTQSLSQELPWHKQPELTRAGYEQLCLAKSRLYHPQIAGKIIETPHYALVTLQKAGNYANGLARQGELCVTDKITQRTEITALDDLRYLNSRMN